MSPALIIGLLLLVVFAASAAAAVISPDLLKAGPTARRIAEQLGIAVEQLMTPTDPATKQRLAFLDRHRPVLLAILREYDPGTIITSAWRPELVNTAVGGAPNSRHLHGLALDFGNAWNLEQSMAAARYLRAHPSAAGIPFRDVLAENDHLHVELLDPLGTLDPGRTAAAWKYERGSIPGQPSSPRFVELA